MRHALRSPLLASAVAFTLLASACGIGSSATDTRVEVWTVEDELLNPLLVAGMEEFNETSEVDVELITFENDPYKQRLQMAMGSSNSPDVFFNWGGGNLAQYVDAGQVLDMTDHLNANPEFRDSFIPSVLEVAELEGRNYGVPMLGVQPVILFYNKQVFADAGVEPPDTLGDLLELVEVFKEQGTTPVALPGAQSWTMLMWISYLVDRIGGAEVYEDISANEENAWNDPAVLEAIGTVQDLVERGAFGSDFASITYDGGAASTLLAEGEAAMMLMGTWEIQNQGEHNPDFLQSGDLGWVPFPTVEGGNGDPDAIVGPPSNFYSVNLESLHTEVALEWLTQHIASEEYVDGMIENGVVPAVVGIEDKLAQTEHAEFTTFVYDLVSEAPTFTPAWDQDLDPAAAETMLTSFQLVFEGEMPPEEFGVVMSETQW